MFDCFGHYIWTCVDFTDQPDLTDECVRYVDRLSLRLIDGTPSIAYAIVDHFGVLQTPFTSLTTSS